MARLWIVLLLCFLHWTWAFDCSLRVGNGIYDLTPLRKPNGGSYKVNGDAPGTFYYNFCGPVAAGACPAEQAVCQLNGAGSRGCGSANAVVLSELDGKDGVQLSYNAGEQCNREQTKARTATIKVQCDKSIETHKVISVTEPRTCYYEIKVASRHGCLQPQEPQLANPVNIFVVVHSHDDVGWIKTVQGYYDEQVHSIITNIVNSLKSNRNRKFIQVEVAFFQMWWDEQKEDMQTLVRELVNNGSLSFAIGGWVMPDEATPSYSSLISQLTEGHQFLLKNFNYIPTVSWQIDPFGASAVVAEIYKLSNFSGHIIQRIDYNHKEEKQQNKSLQFNWKFNSERHILTHLLDNNYCSPYQNGLEIKGPLSPDAIKDKAQILIDFAKAKAMWTRTPNVLIPLGCDFTYSEGSEPQYAALDLIFEYIRNHSATNNVTGVQYSNVADYFAAIAGYSSSFPSYTGDFMPYIDYGDDSWWTGYYTSRPDQKGYIRTAEAVLRAAESIYSSAIYTNYTYLDNTTLDALSQTVAVNLHHDAITGTEKDFVYQDYMISLDNSIPDAQNILQDVLNLLSDNHTTPTHDLSVTTQSINVSIFNSNRTYSGGMIIPIVVYNSLGWKRLDYISVTLEGHNETLDYIVTCQSKLVPSEIIIYENTSTLYFKVVLPPLGFETYHVSANVPPPTPTPTPSPTPAPATNSGSNTGSNTGTNARATARTKPSARAANANLGPRISKRTENTDEEASSEEGIFFEDTLRTMSNQYLKVDFSETNMLGSIALINQNSTTLEQQYMIYDGHAGDGQNSGAYIFRPAGTAYYTNPNNTVSQSNLTLILRESFSFAYQEYDCGENETYVRQIIRMFNDADQYFGNYIELSPTIGVLPPGVELITRFNTSLDTGNVFYTDSNGFRFLKRSFNPSISIAGNYYPTVYASYIKDNATAIGFIFDRAHGFTSTQGMTEIMLHRRSLKDDGRGVGEALNDKNIVRPTMRIVVGPPKEIMASIYRHAYLLNFPPIVTIGAPTTVQAWQTNRVNNFSVLLEEMPEKIHLLDLKLVNSSQKLYIFRLVHLFDNGEHPSLGSRVNLNVQEIFARPYCISALNETTVTANSVSYVHNINQRDYSITIYPKEIKTYLITLGLWQRTCTQEQSNKCGAGAKCISQGCSYYCDCPLAYEYDHTTGECKSNDEQGLLLSIVAQLPLVVIAYLTFVCSYSLRAELRKLGLGRGADFSLPTLTVRRPSTSSGQRSPRSPSGRVRRFMQANKYALEKTFFPSNLQSHHQD